MNYVNQLYPRKNLNWHITSQCTCPDVFPLSIPINTRLDKLQASAARSYVHRESRIIGLLGPPPKKTECSLCLGIAGKSFLLFIPTVYFTNIPPCCQISKCLGLLVVITPWLLFSLNLVGTSLNSLCFAGALLGISYLNIFDHYPHKSSSEMLSANCILLTYIVSKGPFLKFVHRY